jgi:hydrogenase/urease accessory protein HupE
MIKLFFLFIPLLLFAHQSGLSYIDIYESKNHQLHITYKKPLQDLYSNNITIHYPLSCYTIQKEPQEISNGFIINRSTMQCSDKGVVGSRIWIDGLLRDDKGVLIHYKGAQLTKKSLLRSSSPFISLQGKSSRFDLFRSYLILGIEHILSGYDHLLFVLSLVLLAQSTKRLLFAVTAFTLAHSITLASAILGLVNLPALFVEAMIALSILFLARELLTPQKTLTKQHLSIIAFIFGLLHGFGFSNVLKSIGLPQDELALSLFAFNVGIEIGQLLFIVAVIALLWLLKRLYKGSLEKLQKVIVYAIGITAAFWFIERVVLF